MLLCNVRLHLRSLPDYVLRTIQRYCLLHYPMKQYLDERLGYRSNLLSSLQCVIVMNRPSLSMPRHWGCIMSNKGCRKGPADSQHVVIIPSHGFSEFVVRLSIKRC
jgi:hypothetical protein